MMILWQRRAVEANGVVFDVSYVRGPLGFRIALLTDSWGTYIELTEGRSALD